MSSAKSDFVSPEDSVAKNAAGGSLGNGAGDYENLVVVLIALALGMFFWEAFWSGGGLIGGDIYSYFFPQKVFFADELKAGRLPLWNPRTGHGYPVLGESQTAILYPPNLLAYATLTVAESYGYLQLLHYILAFWWTWLYARQIGLSFGGSVAAALTFVYGWFPPRICLEWAIITGAYFPLAFWLTDRYLATRFWRYGIGLSVALGLQLLAGHYHIAFITHGTLFVYVLYSIFKSRTGPAEIDPDGARNRREVAPPRLLQLSVLGWVILAYGIASVQLLPTAELKGRSQRVTADGQEFDPGYGHIPPAYWSQVFLPMKWYRTDISQDDAIQTAKWLAINSGTNKIEAHLYWGLVPFAIMIFGSILAGRSAARIHPLLIPWLILGAIALIYATGWFISVSRFIPGFNFFRGLGRYGLITQWAGALWLGAIVTALLRDRRWWIRTVFFAIFFPCAIFDLFIVSDVVTNSPQTPESPVEWRGKNRSEVAAYFAKESVPPRVFTPGPNVINIVGAGCVPPYLGIGPGEYFDPRYACPKSVEVDGKTPVVSQEQVEWMERMGVTHVLSFDPLRGTDLPLQIEWAGLDPMLNFAWARGENKNYIFRVKNCRGRAYWEDRSNHGKIGFLRYQGDEVCLAVETAQADRLVLTDLSYPGWEVWVDQQYVSKPPVEGMFRAVDLTAGSHEVVWRYRPRSVLYGGVVSLVSLFLLAALGHIKFWHPALVKRIVPWI